MKQSLKQDTLAYQFGVRPGVLRRDMSEVMVPDVVSRLNQFMDHSWSGDLLGLQTGEKPKGHPERDAVIFYMLNHAVTLIRQKKHPFEPLGDFLPVVELYHGELSHRAMRMFFYLMLICTRESRHAKDSYSSQVWKDIMQKYGNETMNFHQTIKGQASNTAADRLKDHPPNMKLGAYTAYMTDLFFEGTFSGGYGGPAWGAVAKTLRDFVNGTLSAELMMDTAFTLAHNNGPIFNKGMLFDGYSNEIYKILDVQRSGQIPQLVANKETLWHKDAKVSGLYTLCEMVLGEAFRGHVDWFLVEELGALHSYKDKQQEQVAKYGYPSKFKAKVEAENLKKQQAKKAAEKLAAMSFEIMPGVTVMKVEIER